METDEPASTQAVMGKERPGITTKMEITDELHGGKHEGYIHANTRPDGTLGEVFLSGFGKEGSNAEGWASFAAIAMSMGIQADFDLTGFVKRVGQMRFEPSGYTNDPDIPYAPSVPAYIVAWVGLRFGGLELKKVVRDLVEGWS